MKYLATALAAAALLAASPSVAAVTIDFEGPTPAGWTIEGQISEGSIDDVRLEPTPSTNHYLNSSTYSGFSSVRNAEIGYAKATFTWGSPDTWNTLSRLDAVGNAFASYSAADLGLVVDGRTGQTASVWAVGQSIYGLRFTTEQPNFEVDDIVLTNDVPEPASWILMLIGFGAIGAAQRGRRSSLVAA